MVPPPLVAAFASAKWHADRRTAILEQAALADFLREGHFERHVRRMRRLYGRRRQALTTALARHLGDEVTVLSDAAGMFLMVRFASGRAAEQARRQGVQPDQHRALLPRAGAAARVPAALLGRRRADAARGHQAAGDPADAVRD